MIFDRAPASSRADHQVDELPVRRIIPAGRKRTRSCSAAAARVTTTSTSSASGTQRLSASRTCTQASSDSAASLRWWVRQVLQGDHFFALLKNRAMTYGAEYALAVACQTDACRARIEWELDLCSLPCEPLMAQPAPSISGART
jgi:hypothetical protein